MKSILVDKNIQSISPILLLLLVTLYTISTPTQALTCACNECNDQENCTTSDHIESRCFKSVERTVDNNTYIPLYRFGCISASEDSLASLQCHATTSKHKEPIFVACCGDRDYCNEELPEPSEKDDPRWAISQLSPVDKTEPPSSSIVLTIIIILVIIITAAFCCAFYVIVGIMFRKCWYRSKPTLPLGGDRSPSSLGPSSDDEEIKKPYLEHHSSPHFVNLSTTASTRAYSVTDYKPDLHPPEMYPSIENTSTLSDMTSGVGTRMLEPRTMARVVGAGETVPVGCGRYGRVFKGVYHYEDVAVKAFRSIDSESWQREENILKKLNHENIVRFIASEIHTVGDYITENWMFLEYCPYGSLCDFLDNNEVCGPQQAIKILYSIIKGLHYLHEDYSQGYKPPIAHRDIKSRNILMKTPDTCCLADFGHAVVKINDNTLDFGGYQRLQVGTVRYMAPEILKPNMELDMTAFYYFAQADIYQYALVLWEVCHRTALDVLHPAGSHKLPYDGVVPHNPDLGDMIKIVCEDNYRPPCPPQWNKHPAMKQLTEIMVECWRANPRSRRQALGIKKALKDMHDSLIPQSSMFYHNNLIDNFSLSSNSKRSTEITF